MLKITIYFSCRERYTFVDDIESLNWNRCDGFFEAIFRQKEVDRLLQIIAPNAIAASIKTPNINKVVMTN